MTSNTSQSCSIFLFYKYHALSDDASITDEYRRALHQLCLDLHLTGRILVGCGSSEGINGTLAGPYTQVRAFTFALSCSPSSAPPHLPHQILEEEEEDFASYATGDRLALQNYWTSCGRFFFNRLQSPPLLLHANDFKWSRSTHQSADQIFPHLSVKLVDELIGSADGLLKGITLGETQVGYLTPHQWHEHVSHRDRDSTLLIDCRNTKEYEIGHFDQAINPHTTTFAQFPAWVNRNRHVLENQKAIYMYCTGGIRCEKSSAYVRRVVPGAVVHHLHGGIHKYLEVYGGVDCVGDNEEEEEEEEEDNQSNSNKRLWKGRNYVFDGRGAASSEETYLGGQKCTHTTDKVEIGHDNNDDQEAVEKDMAMVVGRCVSCQSPFDRFDAECVCTVCNEPTLVCHVCRPRLHEYHCALHQRYKDCYFSDLSRYTSSELLQQRHALQSLLNEITVGRRFKSRRKTLVKQITKVQLQLNCLQGIKENSNSLYDKTKNVVSDSIDATTVTKRRRDCLLAEISALRLSQPPSAFRDDTSGIRVIPAVTRIVQCHAKKKWCGRILTNVVQDEFSELSRPGVLQQVLEKGLLWVNNTPVEPFEASQLRIRMKDVISRVLHWHEPPIQTPAVIPVQAILLPDAVMDEYRIQPSSAIVYVIDKPSSVPVHPAGPYLANSLTLMVEAQENLPSLSLTPLHRTDRVTSGLTLCARDPALSRIFQKSFMVRGAVRKLYLARVSGHFYHRSSHSSSTGVSDDHSITDRLLPTLSIGSCHWYCEGTQFYVQVNAPITTIDPSRGIRTVTQTGKPSTSLFRFIQYCPVDDTSLVACSPVTGRNHQLRVHLQLIQCPVVGDLVYGGRPLPQTQQLRSSDRLDPWQQQQRPCPSPCPSTPSRRSNLSSCSNIHHHDHGHLPSLSESVIRAAQSVCRVCHCQSRIEECFTRAQLLQGGHAIWLHALRYQVRVLNKNPNNSNHHHHNNNNSNSSSSRENHENASSTPTTTTESSSSSLSTLAMLDYCVNLPNWAVIQSSTTGSSIDGDESSSPMLDITSLHHLPTLDGRIVTDTTTTTTTTTITTRTRRKSEE